jgi:two-component system LytT family response regulator
MIKLDTILVDDEPLALELMKACLAEFPEINVVAECRNGEEAIEATVRLNPDLMFLDIQMPGKNGFEVVKALQNDVMPMVIFITTYPQYALDAFDLHAVDYVPKPLDEERLQRAVERAIDRHLGTEQLGGHKRPLIGAIDEVITKLSDHSQDPATADLVPRELSAKKVIIRDSGTVIAVPEQDIDWIDAAGDYMCVHVDGKTHVMRSTVKELLDKLDDKIFRRIHRSTIVNVDRIRAIEPLTKGDYSIELCCGGRLRVSRNYNAVVKGFLKQQYLTTAQGRG